MPVTFPAEITAIYNQLVSAVGFEHPTLMEAAHDIAEYPHLQTLGFSQTVHIQENQFQNAHYVSIALPTKSFPGQRFLLFMDTGDSGSLIYGTVSSGVPSTVEDRNDNGKPDFVYYFNWGGNCCPTQLRLIESTPDEGWADIAPKSNDVYPVGIADLNGDGLFEIEGAAFYPPPLSQVIRSDYVVLIRWFGWNGSAYVDISAHQHNFYETRINRLLSKIVKFSCPINWNTKNLYEVLLNYYAMGQLRNGWKKLQPLLDLDNCIRSDSDKIILERFQQMIAKDSAIKWW
jgi:hypothetical protein